MFFKRKKKEANSIVEEEFQIYEQLMKICDGLRIEGNALVLPELELYIYADLLNVEETMTQIVFQIHHEEFEDPIIDPVCGIGYDEMDSIKDACENFYEHDLKQVIACFQQDSASQTIARTQENHAFHVYHSTLSTHGKREGELPVSFWEWLKDGIQKRLGNKRMYWVKVYCAKMGKKSDIEVRINDVLSKELSSLLQSYVDSWDCLDHYHSEKQCFYFYQKDDTYLPSIFTKQDIIRYSEKAIVMYEKCETKEEHKKLRLQLIKLCKDESLGMELFGFIPELYCKHVFSDLEYGEQLFLIQKGQPTMELYQSQVRSFSYIEETIRRHLKHHHVAQKQIDQIAQFSANYQAIQKAIEEGNELSQLYTPGIGYFVKEGYILR